MNQDPIDLITVGDRPIRLSRPVLPHAARRLAETRFARADLADRFVATLESVA